MGSVPRFVVEQGDDGGQLCDEFPQAAPTMSKHFNVLKDADLIQGDRNGTSIIYRSNVSVLEEALLALFDQFELEANGDP